MKPPACPVEEDVRRWVEARMQWLAKEFGEDRLRAVSVVTPTTDFFPGRWSGTEEEAEALAARVAGYMGLDFNTIEVYAYDLPAPAAGVNAAHAAGLYHEDDGRFMIGYARDELRRPLGLAAIFAHEFAHIHLLGHGRVRPEEPDHELLTDLCAMATGMGVVVANAAVFEEVDRQGAYVSSGVGRSGYLDLRTFGYASAVFAHLRREDRPAWAGHLRRDVRATMGQGRKWIEAVGLCAATGSEPFTVPTSFQERVGWAGAHANEQRELAEEGDSPDPCCHYCGAKARKYADDAGRPVCGACRRSILENYEELVSHHDQTEQSTRRMVPLWKLALWAFVALLVAMAYVDLKRR